jgi:hypothetical protein
MSGDDRRLRARWSAVPLTLCVLFGICPNAGAQTSAETPPHLDSVTVEAARHRELVVQQAKAFVSHIAPKPYDTSMARWQTVAPICPLVAGLPRDDGEYILTRVSGIAAAAGAPLAPEHCKPNFYIVFSATPDALLKAWNRRDVYMFGDETEQGGGKIRKFLNSNSPIRVWYNAELFSDEGTPLGNRVGGDREWRANLRARATRLLFNETRDLTSALVMIDAPRAQGVNFGQLAAYIALVGLAEVRPDADQADAPTILHLFSSSDAERPAGLSRWDQAFLKALYHTEHTDRQQLEEIKTAVAAEIAPR